jgi:uncharacterized membrane protein (UPF0127 family)
MGRIIAVLVGVVACVALWTYLARQASPAPLTRLPLTIETVNGPVRFTVEVAQSAAQQERGLMYRTSLAPDAGMLFDLHAEKRVALWMKDTPIPLDMVFIKANGTIAQIAANATPLSLKPIASRARVRAVLEIAGGRAGELQLRPGDHVVNEIFVDTAP